MKKILSVLLCAILLIGIVPYSTCAEAAEAGVINITVTWDPMSFVYAPNYPGEWDVDTHTYKNAPVGGWKVSDDTNNITVTNYSDVAEIRVDFEFEQTGSIGLDFYSISDMGTPVESVEIAAGCSHTVKAIPNRKLTDTSGSPQGLGSITIAFSKVVNS